MPVLVSEMFIAQIQFHSAFLLFVEWKATDVRTRKYIVNTRKWIKLNCFPELNLACMFFGIHLKLNPNASSMWECIVITMNIVRQNVIVCKIG